MKGINVGRWIAGGVVAGVVMWVMEGLASLLYMGPVKEAMDAHGLSMDMGVGMMVLTVVMSLLVGFTLTFFYAAVRPRFGPGPGTAVIVALALWVGAYLLQLLGYYMIGLYPVSLLVSWGAIGLVELVVCGIIGAAIYREA